MDLIDIVRDFPNKLSTIPESSSGAEKQLGRDDAAVALELKNVLFRISWRRFKMCGSYSLLIRLKIALKGERILRTNPRNSLVTADEALTKQSTICY